MSLPAWVLAALKAVSATRLTLAATLEDGKETAMAVVWARVVAHTEAAMVAPSLKAAAKEAEATGAMSLAVAVS